MTIERRHNKQSVLTMLADAAASQLVFEGSYLYGRTQPPESEPKDIGEALYYVLHVSELEIVTSFVGNTGGAPNGSLRGFSATEQGWLIDLVYKGTLLARIAYGDNGRGVSRVIVNRTLEGHPVW